MAVQSGGDPVFRDVVYDNFAFGHACIFAVVQLLWRDNGACTEVRCVAHQYDPDKHHITQSLIMAARKPTAAAAPKA